MTFWASRNLVPEKFGSQEIWAQKNLGPKNVGPCMKMPYDDFHAETKFLRDQMRSGTISVIASHLAPLLSSLHSQNFDLSLLKGIYDITYVLAGKVLQKETNMTLSVVQTVISYQLIFDVFNLSNEHITCF